jgi:hypothetical protein
MIKFTKGVLKDTIRVTAGNDEAIEIDKAIVIERLAALGLPLKDAKKHIKAVLTGKLKELTAGR